MGLADLKLTIIYITPIINRSLTMSILHLRYFFAVIIVMTFSILIHF